MGRAAGRVKHAVECAQVVLCGLVLQRHRVVLAGQHEVIESACIEVVGETRESQLTISLIQEIFFKSETQIYLVLSLYEAKKKHTHRGCSRLQRDGSGRLR